ncbi:hypothetical protein WAB17_08550 [Parerythrobacter aurantius]|uniref:hypothetical protein n=1 Tax=Parerythrobacter aurantius TaxID=3127706 RepID=UPI003255445A
MTVAVLDMKNMDRRHPGLTPAIAQHFFEAASVCLQRHHEAPAVFQLENGSAESQASVSWLPASPSLSAAYANTIDTTEAGAYGICLAAVELLQGLVAVHRAETLTGADYYIAPRGTAVSDLENAYRFEISGVDQGRRSQCDQRLRSKVDQTKRGTSFMRAIAGVAGFEQKVILLSETIGS